MSIFKRILKYFQTSDELKIPKAANNMIPGIKLNDLILKNRYRTNIVTMSCGCPEFIKYQHNRYAIDDIRRMCKHLLDLYKKTVDYSSTSDINKAIIDNGFSIRGNYRIIQIKNDDTDEFFEVGITFNLDNPWIDIFSKDENGNYRRYGYSIEELVWAKKEKPPIIYEPIEDYIKQNI